MIKRSKKNGPASTSPVRRGDPPRSVDKRTNPPAADLGFDCLGFDALQRGSVARELTYRRSQSGLLQAAYCGQIRVGYVEQRQYDRWLYQLSLLEHGGGYSHGIMDTEEQAKERLQSCFHYWLDCAGLQYKEKA